MLRMNSMTLVPTFSRIAIPSIALALLAGFAFGQGDPAVIFSGDATTYDLGGSTGACSLRASEVSTKYAALNAPQHASGEWCGAWVKVTGPAGTAVVQIVDVAPTLGTGDLDMSPSAFAAVSGNTLGIYPISWHWVSAPGSIGPNHFYSQGSNPYYLKLQAANIVNPVRKMEILHSGGYVEMTRTLDNHFTFTGAMISEPFTIRVTDVLGNPVISTGLTIAGTSVGQNGNGNFPAVVEADIVVEKPIGTVIADGGTGDVGFSIDGATTSASFTIRNQAPVALTGITLTMDGADAGNFSIVSLPATTIPAGGTSAFTVAFVSATAVQRTAALHIASSSAVPVLASYDIQLTGRGISSASDTDADGMNDAAEVKLAALGFNWQVAQTSLVGTYYGSAATAGLYTTAQVQALNVGTPLLQRNPSNGRFTLTLGLRKSTNLSTFTAFPFTAPDVSVNGAGKIEFSFLPTDNAAFYRLGAE